MFLKELFWQSRSALLSLLAHLWPIFKSSYPPVAVCLKGVWPDCQSVNKQDKESLSLLETPTPSYPGLTKVFALIITQEDLMKVRVSLDDWEAELNPRLKTVYKNGKYLLIKKKKWTFISFAEQ